jgi:uncharacterized membrane protein YuzA (DUF378 family)
MKVLDLLALALLVIGGLNWGLIGCFDFNLITYLFNRTPEVVTVIYILVGLAAVYRIFRTSKVQKVLKKR